MNNKRDLFFRLSGAAIIIAVLTIIAIRKPHDVIISPHTCKEDSLQTVINQLQIDIENEENGWDNKEKRYEQIIFEYEYGLDHLKYHHTEAYREFHRIIGYRENYSHEIERDNNKRLKINKW